MTAAPPGFTEIDVGGEFIRTNGPLWIAKHGTTVRLGFQVEARHTNGMHSCHGGMMATFCDMLMPLTARALIEELAGTFLPTINLQVDYVAPVQIGQWVEGQAQVLRSTGGMVFMQGLVRADGSLVARASGILKISKRFDEPPRAS